MSNRKLWITKDKKKIRIKDMEDSHLLNTISLLERKSAEVFESEIQACLSISFQGEQAQFDQDNFLSNSTYEDYLPEIYYDMIDEKLRRGL